MIKEMIIVKKINELFRERDQRMVDTIREAIFTDNQRIYRMFRKEYEAKLSEIQKERTKLKKRKKITKEKIKLQR